MGVLTDYFRAPSRAAVEAAMRASTSSPMDGDPHFDGVALKSIDPPVLLGRLIAAISGVEWHDDLVPIVHIYPPAETMPADDDWRTLPEDSPWATGPWVVEMSPVTRQTLASLDPARIPIVASAWIAAEELHGRMDQATAEEIVDELRRLAQRAEGAGELLYWWGSL